MGECGDDKRTTTKTHHIDSSGVRKGGAFGFRADTRLALRAMGRGMGMGDVTEITKKQRTKKHNKQRK